MTIELLKPAVKCPDPCDEKLARVDTDRLKTTYQADYRDPGEYNDKTIRKYHDYHTHARALLCVHSCIFIFV